MSDDWEKEWEERVREISERNLHDPMRLHSEACLGHARKVPNLTLGGLDTIEFQEFAFLIDPPVRCLDCGTEPEGDQAIVFRTHTEQHSYLCAACWAHMLIPAFGIYKKKENMI